MTNHYYSQQLQEKGSIIDLLAVEDNNKIMMIISDDLFNTTSAITLTEQEQDDLIAGILERRGIQLVKMEISETWVEIPTTPITAEGNQQSKVHPHKLHTR
jgi:hypothetical protein